MIINKNLKNSFVIKINNKYKSKIIIRKNFISITYFL